MNKHHLRRGLLASAMAVIVATGLAATAAADAADPSPTEPVSQRTPGVQPTTSAEVAAQPTLYFMRSTANNMSLVQDSHGFVAKTMPPPNELNPLYTGQLYEFVYHLQSDAYEVMSNNFGTCLDIDDGYSEDEGRRLAFRDCDGTPSQLWESKFNTGGWYLKNEWSGLYATQSSLQENAPIIQWHNMGLTRQRFHMPMFTG
jgi:hypothetical protein